MNQAIKNETLKELTKLCRIECQPADEEHFLKDLNSMLAYFEQLQEVDTDGVKPLDHILESLVNVLREDTIEPPLSRDLFLENAPSKTGGMIRVPSVIKGA